MLAVEEKNLGKHSSSSSQGAQIALNMPSTLIEVEVEVAVQAKYKVVAVVTKTKASNRINLMMDKCRMYVEEEIREAGGVKEVAETSSETMQEMI